MCPHDVAERYPILSQHWPSFPPVAASAPHQIRQLRFEREVLHLHQLGPRPVAELLLELGHAHDLAGDIEARLARFSRLDPATVRSLGGDRFPLPPIHAVGDGRR